RKAQEQEYLKIRHKDEKGELIEKGEVKIPPVLTVKTFASILNLPATDVIKELMRNGVMASLNQRIDYDTAAIIAEDLGYTAVEQKVHEELALEKDQKVKQILADDTAKLPRPPVIVVMGHVDHGKTKLLDAIRKTNVVAGEAGGITQHIGAYQIMRKGKLITFIDTPGHEAFTAMRSRGANVADIAILVVAANDSVKPQTIEAQKIAENAGIPIVVAINKIDLPDANIEKVKQDLAQHNLLTEEWGGKTICVPISAKQNENINELLEQVLLVAEMSVDKIVANPDGEVVGTIIESHVDKGFGPVATVLVKNGTLHRGDQMMINGDFYGKIRAMHNYLGQEIDSAGPSVPAQLVGMKSAPVVGDILEITTGKVKKTKAHKLGNKEDTFMQNTVDKDDEHDEGATKINIILRSDVLGSQEAVIESLEKLNTEDVKIKFIARGLGNITESDVMSADATGAMLVGFSVVPSSSAASLAQEKGVEIKKYKIIYELIDAVREKANEMIKAEVIREDLGQAEVIKIFKKQEKSMIVGCRVKSGSIEKGAVAVILRHEEFISKGKIVELQIGKEVVSNVVKGQEFGMQFDGQPLVEVGDILDVYFEKEIKKRI
ncbi:translation initiation factor IF-2, partial [Candidatus Falkowbacteria bacterium RIFOXYD2_FULL_35_9]